MNKESDVKRSPCRCRSKIRNDIILIAVILIAVTLFSLVMLLIRKEGDCAYVTVDGKPFGEYPLCENVTVEIGSGDGYNILVIEDGSAYVREASCPDGICSSHRPIRYGGESIVCLPNKVVIEIVSNGESPPT